MVRVGGFEPPTFWFVAKRSIQLSYTLKIRYVIPKNGARLICLKRSVNEFLTLFRWVGMVFTRQFVWQCMLKCRRYKTVIPCVCSRFLEMGFWVKKAKLLPLFRQKILTRILIVLAMLSGVTGFATLGFMIIEGAKPFDAFYMAVVTFTTVGYGDMVPSSLHGRMFAILTIFMGLTGSGVSIALLVDLFFENTLMEILRGRKVGKRILMFRNHHIVCGYGVTGSCIVRSLLDNGEQVVVIEQNHDLDYQEDPKLLVIMGDARKDEILIEAAIDRAKGLAATLTSDSDNVFVVLTARSLNQKLEIVSRYKDADTEKKLYAAGANHAVSPYRMGGHRMFLALTAPTMASMVDGVLRHSTAGVTFSEIHLSENYKRIHPNLSAVSGWAMEEGVIIVAALGRDETSLFNPQPSCPSENIARLLVLGEMGKNAALSARLA